MTKSPINYKNGRIYIIRNTKNDKVYVGSTTQSLSKRFCTHKGSINYSQKINYPLYKAMREIGVEHFYIEIIEMFPCDSKEELHSREGHWIRQFQSCNEEKGFNFLIAGRNIKQWREDNKEYDKKYYQDNQQRITEYNRARYASNKEAILAQHKEYRDNNKSKVRGWKRLYREKYKDEINARQREKVVCECSSQVSRVHLSRHRSSKLHQDWEKSKQLKEIN
jgi:group I intron endonuclease